MINAINCGLIDQKGIPDDYPLDSQPVQGNKSKQADILKFFQHRYSISSPHFLKRIWGALDIDRDPATKHPTTVGHLRTIDRLFNETLVYSGPGMQRPQHPKNNSHDYRAIHSVVGALLHGEGLSKNIVNPSLLKSVFVKTDPVLLEVFRKELEWELLNLHNNPPKDEKEAFVWRGFFGNIIALLPFTYPKPGTTITIPVLDEGRSRLATYTIDVLDLTSSKHSCDMTALTLQSESPGAPPLISFIGTTYPAGQGFASTILADFTPGKSVGEGVYGKNRDKIIAALRGKSGFKAFGMSLGGAMALLLSQDKSKEVQEALSEVNVYNPPGLNKSCWNEGLDKCRITIFTQPGDIVTKLGFWPTTPNVSIYRVYNQRLKGNENFIVAHARIYTGCKEIAILKLDPKKLNNSTTRKLLTWIHKYFARVLVWWPIKAYLFFRYGIRQLFTKA